MPTARLKAIKLTNPTMVAQRLHTLRVGNLVYVKFPFLRRAHVGKSFAVCMVLGVETLDNLMKTQWYGIDRALYVLHDGEVLSLMYNCGHTKVGNKNVPVATLRMVMGAVAFQERNKHLQISTNGKGTLMGVPLLMPSSWGRFASTSPQDP